MTTLLQRPLWMLAVVLVPVLASAQPAAPAPKPSFTPTQLAEGLRSGLITLSNQALVTGAIKVPTPTLFTKSRATLTAAKKVDTIDRFEATLDSAVKKLEPKVADEIRKVLKTVKIDDAQTVLAGGPKAATNFLRTTSLNSLNSAVLPLIRKEIADADLAGKCRAVVLAINPAGFPEGSRVIVDLDYHIRKAMLDQSFALLAKQELEARTNPSLFKGNALAQKVFEAYKK